MRNAVALLLTTALLAAGCGTAAGTHTGTAAATSAPAASTPAPSPSSLPSSASPDVTACKAMEAYPRYTTPAQTRAYIAFLGKRVVSAPGTSERLDDAAQVFRADLSAYLLGAASQSQVLAGARKVQDVCDGYGVTGPG